MYMCVFFVLLISALPWRAAAPQNPSPPRPPCWGVCCLPQAPERVQGVPPRRSHESQNEIPPKSQPGKISVTNELKSSLSWGAML